MGDYAGGGRPLRAVDRADPAGADVAVGEMAQVEHLALAVVLLDEDARSGWVDREHHRGIAVAALGAVVVAGELELVAGAELLLDLGERLGMGAAQRAGFQSWVLALGLGGTRRTVPPCLERWQRHLFLYRKANGEPLTTRSQIAHTQPLKAFFRWLARENHILYNPASELELPRIDRRLPRNVMTLAEAERVLAVPNIKTAMGLRDRAMLETLYSTGCAAESWLTSTATISTRSAAW